MKKKLFFGIILLAFVFRIVFLTTAPLNGNEGDNLDISKNMFEGVSSWERHPQSPPLYPILWTVSVSFFGMNEFGMRFFSLVFGVLTVFLMYLFVRLYFSEHTALLAAFFTSLMPFFVLYSRDGHFESTQIFFTFLAITVLEYAWRKQTWWVFLLAGLSSGLVFCMKHNGFVIIALYWLFVLVEQRKHVFQILKCACFINGIGLFLLLLSTELSLRNIVYLVYGILFWSINQSVTANVPWHYGIVLLLEGFSPLFFGMVMLACLKTLQRAKKSRGEKLCAWLFMMYLVVVFLQARKYPRHVLLAIPYATVLGAQYLARMKSRVLRISLLILIVISMVGWTTYHVYEGVTTTAVRDVAVWVSTHISRGARVYVDGGEYWSFMVYTNYSFNLTSLPYKLKQGDVAVVHELQGNFYTGSPLQNDLVFWMPEYARQYDFKRFNESVLLYRIPYGHHGNLSVVRVVNNTFKPVPKKNEGASHVICAIWMNPGIVSSLAHTILPPVMEKDLTKKCTVGCVKTCEMF